MAFTTINLVFFPPTLSFFHFNVQSLRKLSPFFTCTCTLSQHDYWGWFYEPNLCRLNKNQYPPAKMFLVNFCICEQTSIFSLDHPIIIVYFVDIDYNHIQASLSVSESYDYLLLFRLYQNSFVCPLKGNSRQFIEAHLNYLLYFDYLFHLIYAIVLYFSDVYPC